MNAAGAKHGAESAEVRNSGTDRPQSKQRRGVATGKGAGTKCGKSAVKVRNLSDSSSPLNPSPSVQTPASATAGERAALRPTPSLVPSPSVKTRRESAPAQALTHGPAWPPNAPRCSYQGMPAHEAAVIDAALAIIALRLREPGAACDSPQAVRDYLRLQLAGADRELFGVLFLDARNAVIAFEVLFAGTLTQTSVYPREVVRRALELHAAAVILTHNHPSGAAEPSPADEYLTHTLGAALKLVDVRILDHMVVGGLDSVSLAERGLLEPACAARATSNTQRRKHHV